MMIPVTADDERRLAELAALTDEQRDAVRLAVRLWVRCAADAGYEPIVGWRNFDAEVWHSALLGRLLSGKPPLEQRPPTRHSYPVYPD